MVKKLMLLNEGDVKILQRIVDNVRNRSGNPRSRTPVPDRRSQAPGVYVALASAEALVAASPYDKPSKSLNCVPHRIVYTTDVTPVAELRALEDETLPGYTHREVYNVGSSAVSSWQLITRDKFGQWYFPPKGGAPRRLIEIETGQVRSITNDGIPVELYLGTSGSVTSYTFTAAQAGSYTILFKFRVGPGSVGPAWSSSTRFTCAVRKDGTPIVSGGAMGPSVADPLIYSGGSSRDYFIYGFFPSAVNGTVLTITISNNHVTTGGPWDSHIINGTLKLVESS